MTLSAVAFAALVWGSLVSVMVIFGYLLWIVLREARAAGDSTGTSPEIGP